MRPIRALAGLAMLVALWLVWRAPALVADLDRYSAAAHVAQARAAQAGGRVAEAIEELRIALAEEPTNRAARALLRVLTRVRRATVRVATPAPLTISFAAIGHRPSRKVRSGRAIHVASPGPAPADSPVERLATPYAPPSSAPSIAPTPVASPAEVGYAALAAGNRRRAVAAFRAALAETPDDPRVPQWRGQLALLEKRWSGSVYTLLRDDGAANLAATPVLGAGQSGAQLLYVFDPLAPRQLSIEGRITAPNKRADDAAQAALGVTWQAAPHLAITAERLVRLGDQSRNAWTLRAAGGIERSGAIAIDAYAEAGIVGLRHAATYAAAQGHATRRIGPVAVGAGAWASVQHDSRTVGRFEIGPSLRLRHGALDLSADYRLRLAGNAAPGSGPAVTLAAYF